MDVCDGTEPSIEDLLSGFDSHNIDYVRAKGGTSNISLDIGDKEIKMGEINEVGPTNGLVGYYPFNKDASDYSPSGNDGVAVGASIVPGNGADLAYDISVDGHYIDLGSNIMFKSGGG